ncbi:hypothetical protein [Mycobacterium sp. NPDC050041]|uniref:hypothetical protein n=1 Tax=Mycobacterium sp. NPDC050041 TaxID=3364293 RepID=UPI003C2C1270
MTDSSTTLNLPLARKVLEHLEAHPDEHDQRHFGYRTPCGTTLCIAGTALMLNGDPIHWSDQGYLTNGPGTSAADELDVRAAAVLGLSRIQAAELFYEAENRPALAMLRAHIAVAERAQS